MARSTWPSIRSANGEVDVIAVQPDGQVLAGGFFTSIGGQTRNYIARLERYQRSG